MTNLSSSLYIPLALLLVLYALLSIGGQIAHGRGSSERAESLHGAAFGVALLTAAYTLVLLFAAATSYPNRLFDALTIVLIVVLFFAVLLFALFVLFELLGDRVGGRARR